MRLIFVILCASFSFAAQNQEGDFAASGVVVNSATGEPIRNARVTAIKAPQFDQAHPATPQNLLNQNYTTFSGSAGEFQFTGLPSGQYNFNALKPGFLLYFPKPPLSPTPNVVQLNASVTGVQIKLAPLGVIEGKAADQNGEPVGGVSISAFLVNIMDGLRNMTAMRTVVTDDQGAFRIWNLNPGKYYIKAMGKSGGTYMFVGEGTTRYDSTETFPPVYSGGARDLDAATPIMIEAGTQAHVDFSLTLEPAYKIRGTLQNFTPHQTVKFEVLQGDEEAGSSRVTLNGTDGRFEVQDVANGTYILRATQGIKSQGEAAVTVKGATVEGVSLVLQPPVTIKGVVHVIGETPKAPKAAPSAEEADFANVEGPPSCNVLLRSSAHRTDFGHPTRPQKNGEFTIENVFPGTYRVEISCGGGYAASAMSGSMDFLANPQIVIQPGAPPAPIEVTLKPGGGTLKANFKMDALPESFGLLLVPAFSASTGPMQEFASPEGAEIENLAPGDYLVYAFSTPEQIEFRNPAVLQAITGGTSVHIDDGRTTEVTISSFVK